MRPLAAIAIRVLTPDDWALYKDLRLGALAESPEAFGSTLAREQDRSDDDWAARLAGAAGSAADLPLVAVVGGQPAGLAWGRIEAAEPEAAHLYQMWVAPAQRGRGVGQMLLRAVIDWATAQHAAYLHLGVTLRDSPAMRLYTRAGFEPSGPPEPLRPGADLLALPMRLKL